MRGELHNVIACFTMKGAIMIASVLAAAEQFDPQDGVLISGWRRGARRFKDGVTRAATLRPHVLVEVPAPWLAPNPARDTR